ncbi:4-(cytidine 5'-diphospho)-2-C-methyl-D-erythritol kinase [Solimonas marina]|uniref:4-diphosphocytidyl-2-C-methyl-D-erythritol kinase n=1 Tax=Solimonas marina TaxID=2714601 RepID=A0A969WBR8_9GAMM|nr:4-(cytidine 5'-diphospho)-2-C-methyl-D-erythritol kinase [Solimonas marina]NKF23624.1 4-(cytidine 5'-diphospho)-2-C-methyl-D-erythritol kinase [Solimonas marina]
MNSDPTSPARPFTTGFAWPAPAKLNLFLHVTGRRADGYHELQTLFQFVELADMLYFTPRGDGEFNVSGLPDGIRAEDDLILRAANALRQASGAYGLGADIRLEKRIPLGAGLGGGSSNAATTLVALDRLWNLGMPNDELAYIGLSLGADVPVFVRGLSAWAEGVGERLRPVVIDEPTYVIVVPPVEVSTRDIFQAPELPRDHFPIEFADFLAGRGRNDCEPITCARYPQVGEALAWLRKRASKARMSGTGASVFAAFAYRDQAEEVAAEVPDGWQAFVTQGRNRSPLLDAIARS